MTAWSAEQSLSSVALAPGPQSSGRVIQTSLAALRKHLGMDVAFLGRFYAGRRWFEFVDSDSSFCPVQAGASDPLEESYCARVVDGRLPQLVRDAAKEPEVAALPVTVELPVGAHVSVPLRRASGETFGTLCCFSHQPDPTLRERDLQLVRMFADLVSVHMEALLEHDESVESSRGDVLDVIDNGGPMMAMQPVVDLATKKVVGYEALARFSGRPAWSPQRWFAEAARAGLGPQLERSAIASALRLLSRLPSGTTMAVNVSVATLLHPGLMDMLTGEHARRLVVELTEHVKVESYEAAMHPLARLREAGARIAVDDAGSGYAGLEHILQLQPEVLKLDRQLVTGLGNHAGRQAMVEAMVGFARRMGTVVVAEGVETAEDLETLQRTGVQLGQGYHLGRPSLEFAREPWPSGL